MPDERILSFKTDHPFYEVARDVICKNFSYKDKLSDGTDNPANKDEFFLNIVCSFIKNQIVASDVEKARELASQKSVAETII